MIPGLTGASSQYFKIMEINCEYVLNYELQSSHHKVLQTEKKKILSFARLALNSVLTFYKDSPLKKKKNPELHMAYSWLIKVSLLC